MEESKEKNKIIIMQENKDEVVMSRGGDNFNNMFQKPYECIEDVVRAILRCLGFEQPSHEPVPSCPSCSETTTTTTTTAAEEEEEETCFEEEVPPPTQPPQLGGGSVCDGGGDGDADGGSNEPDAEHESLDGSQVQPHVTVEAITIRRRPPRPGVSSGKDPQIH